MLMKEWLALRRRRLAWCVAGAVAIRIAATLLLRFAGGDAASWDTARLVVVTALDVGIIALAIAVAIAFVQYGRIYRARVPTE